jgi:hypothetical protein
VGVLFATSTCGNSGDGGGSARAACFPPCLANLVKRCPLTSACQVNLEPSSSAANPGESPGVATCFSSGEREREASDEVTNRDLVYVKAADGSECYEVSGRNDEWDVSANGVFIATVDTNFASGESLTVTCAGGSPQPITGGPDCHSLPWDNKVACTDSTKLCTFGDATSPPVLDPATHPGPMPGCDPTKCTSPPADTCEMLGGHTVAHQYPSGGTCGPTGCVYTETPDPCYYGCYQGSCTQSLKGVTNVTAVVQGTMTPVTLTGGGTAPASSAVTVTAQTSPRGATEQVQLFLTVDQKTSTLGMTPDPNMPDQADYDQWTVDIPATNSVLNKVSFYLTAKGYGVIAGSSGPMPGTDWGYTTN